MLDIPNHPVLDKQILLGGCVRLSLTVDALRLRNEIGALPNSTWGTTGGRVGVHMAAEAIFLRGYAPAEGEKPIEDRSTLDLLPYVRRIITEFIPAQPLRCLLARLPAGAMIAPHIDRAPYFAKTLRIHVPMTTNEQAWMQCAGESYQMRVGEVWALNNSTVHAVWNQHDTQDRIHLICDFLPTPELLQLVADGDRNLGRKIPEVSAHFLTA